MLKADQPGLYSHREPQKILEIKSVFFKHQMKTSEVGALWRQESFLNQGFYKKLGKIISHKTEQQRTTRAKFQSSYKNKENKEQNNIPRLWKHRRDTREPVSWGGRRFSGTHSATKKGVTVLLRNRKQSSNHCCQYEPDKSKFCRWSLGRHSVWM